VHDRHRIIGKHTGHRREVADVPVHDAEQRDDRGLVGGDRIEIAHRSLSRILAVLVGGDPHPLRGRRALHLVSGQIFVRHLQSDVMGESAARAAVLASAAPADNTHIDQLFSARSSVTRLIAILRTFEQPGCFWISANARACKSCIESRVFAIQVTGPYSEAWAILCSRWPVS